MGQKKEMEGHSQEKLGCKGNASLACMGDESRGVNTGEGEKGWAYRGVWDVEAGTGSSSKRRVV